MAYKTTLLYQSCENGDFWSLPDQTVLETIRDSFPAELNRLKRAYGSPRAGIKTPDTPSISVRLFDEDYPEINRTLVGVLALRWIYHNQYETFIGTQPPSIALKKRSFDWMRQLFLAELNTADDLYLLILSMIINDLGKDPQLATDYAAFKKCGAVHANHDIILCLAGEAGMVDALNAMPEIAQEKIMAGIKLGASFNFGQLAQAENVPASLSGLWDIRGKSDAFNLHFLEQILDLAGASGHEDWTCARKLVEPILRSYKTVYETAEGIISGRWDLQQGYDAVLSKAGRRAEKAGFLQSLDLSNDKDRAMLRIFCLGNVSNASLAEIFWTAFHDTLEPPTQELLTKGLNRYGKVGEPAVQPTYMPAMFTKALSVAEKSSKQDKINVVTVLMEYLALILQVFPQEMESLPENVTVIERDVRVIEETIKSKTFVDNPMDFRERLRSQDVIPKPSAANVAGQDGPR